MQREALDSGVGVGRRRRSGRVEVPARPTPAGTGSTCWGRLIILDVLRRYFAANAPHPAMDGGQAADGDPVAPAHTQTLTIGPSEDAPRGTGGQGSTE